MKSNKSLNGSKAQQIDILIIIDQLLTLSRIQPNEQITFGKKLMINKVLETFIAENAIKAIEKDIEIVFYPSQQHLYCYSNDYLLVGYYI